MIIAEERIGKVVDMVSGDVGYKVHYSYGHLREIIDILGSYSMTDKFRKEKYPRIMLLCDFKESIDTSIDYERQINAHILIVANSSSDYRASTRMEKVFKPVLLPIADSFISRLASTPYIHMYPTFDMIKRYSMSNALNEAVRQQGEKNLFNDKLDGIELVNLRLNLDTNCKE